MNQVDRLFNEKLSDHSVAPPASTWDRIEAGLAKKNSTVLWMRWAAILVPATILGLLYLGKPGTTTNKLAEVKKPTQTTVSVAPTGNAIPSVPQITNAPAKERRKPVSKQKEVQQPITGISQEDAEVTISLVEPVGPQEEIMIEPSPEPVVLVAQEVKPLVIVYTLESILPSAELVTKKPSSLERVVKIAQAVKYSDPLGDLRMMKDGLLAIDLRKKSTKKN